MASFLDDYTKLSTVVPVPSKQGGGHPCGEDDRHPVGEPEQTETTSSAYRLWWRIPEQRAQGFLRCQRYHARDHSTIHARTEWKSGASQPNPHGSCQSNATRRQSNDQILILSTYQNVGKSHCHSQLHSQSVTNIWRDQDPSRAVLRYQARRHNDEDIWSHGVCAHSEDPTSKLDPVSKKGILVGYEPGSKACRILMEDTKKIVISRDITFDEDTKGQCAANSPKTHVRNSIDISSEDAEQDHLHAHEENAEAEGAQPAAGAAAATPRRYPLRERRPPTEWYKATLATEELKEPSTYEEAVSGEDADLWKRAMDEQMTSLHAIGVWHLRLQ